MTDLVATLFYSVLLPMVCHLQRVDRSNLAALNPEFFAQIGAIDIPLFDDRLNTSFSDNDTVIGIVHKGITKAYPLKMLQYYQVVNDEVAGQAIAVTYSPLCDAAVVYVRRVDKRTAHFAPTKYLVRTCGVLYDDVSNSLWSQVWGIGINGSANNHVLFRLPSIVTPLYQWIEHNYNSLILSRSSVWPSVDLEKPFIVSPTYRKNGHIYLTGDVRARVDKGLREARLHVKSRLTYIWAVGTRVPQNQFWGETVFASQDDMRVVRERNFTFAGRTVYAFWDDTYDVVRFYRNYLASSALEIPSCSAFAYAYFAHFMQ